MTPSLLVFNHIHMTLICTQNITNYYVVLQLPEPIFSARGTPHPSLSNWFLKHSLHNNYEVYQRPSGLQIKIVKLCHTIDNDASIGRYHNQQYKMRPLLNPPKNKLMHN